MTTTTKPAVVLVCPSDRDSAPIVMYSWGNVIAHAVTDGVYLTSLVLGDTYADMARNICVTHALDAPGEPTHIMWFDSDQTMPGDTVARLLSHRKAAVGGLYYKRQPPFEPVAYDFVDGDHPFHMRTRELPDDPHGLVKVDGLGLGATLVRLDVYLAMAEHYGDPVWHRLSPPGDGHGHGEDVWFFRRLKDMGVDDVWLDTDLRCGHVRRDIVGTAHYESYRQAVARREITD